MSFCISVSERRFYGCRYTCDLTSAHLSSFPQRISKDNGDAQQIQAHLAVERPSYNRSETKHSLLMLLLEWGAGMFSGMKNNQGCTPLDEIKHRRHCTNQSSPFHETGSLGLSLQCKLAEKLLINHALQPLTVRTLPNHSWLPPIKLHLMLFNTSSYNRNNTLITSSLRTNDADEKHLQQDESRNKLVKMNPNNGTATVVGTGLTAVRGLVINGSSWGSQGDKEKSSKLRVDQTDSHGADASHTNSTKTSKKRGTHSFFAPSPFVANSASREIDDVEIYMSLPRPPLLLQDDTTNNLFRQLKIRKKPPRLNERHLRDEFRRLDTCGNGYLTLAELKQAYREYE